MIYKFDIPALATSVNALYKRGKYGNVFKNKNAQVFLNEVWYATKRPKQPLSGDLLLTVTFVFKSKAKYQCSDVDNLLKATIDAIAECQVIENDKYIIKIIASKQIGKKDCTHGQIEY